MNCLICNKHFSKKSNLNKHRKITKCSKAIECKTCHKLYVNESTHYPDCNTFLLEENARLRKENDQLRFDSERYVSRILDLQEKIENLDALQNQIKELAEKQRRPVIHNHHHNNINIQNLQVLNIDDFDQFTEFLTIDHIKKGTSGYAEFAVNYPLNNKIVCTDFSRRKLKYRTNDGWKNDINLLFLSKELFRSINDRNRELILQYARDYIDTLNDPEQKMNAYCQFMNYISLIKDGSQGMQHNLYPDFVKHICTMSH